jgi:hypothetical protein
MKAIALASLLLITSAAVATPPFVLTSPDVSQGHRMAESQVYDGFGCSGGTVSPALAWQNAPKGTRSFALMVHDPDAPTGSGWWHWVVYDIPATVSSLPRGAGKAGGAHGLPAGAVEGPTDFGSPGYGGPCPPPGKPHHYHFRLYALKVEKLAVPPGATAALIGFNVSANALASAEIVPVYSR